MAMLGPRTPSCSNILYTGSTPIALTRSWIRCPICARVLRKKLEPAGESSQPGSGVQLAARPAWLAHRVVRHGRDDLGLQAEAVRQVGRAVELAARDMDLCGKPTNARSTPESWEGAGCALARPRV